MRPHASTQVAVKNKNKSINVSNDRYSRHSFADHLECLRWIKGSLPKRRLLSFSEGQNQGVLLGQEQVRRGNLPDQGDHEDWQADEGSGGSWCRRRRTAWTVHAVRAVSYALVQCNWTNRILHSIWSGEQWNPHDTQVLTVLFVSSSNIKWTGQDWRTNLKCNKSSGRR